MRHRLSCYVACSLSCLWITRTAAQPSRPAVIVRFDSILSSQISQNHVLQPEAYRYAVLTTLNSWYPVGDADKRDLLRFLGTIRSNTSELGMAAAALIPFHDPATVRPILARARNDSVSSFMSPFLVDAAARVLWINDLAIRYRSPHDSNAQQRLSMLEQFADEAARSSIGHMHALHLRQQLDRSRTATRPDPDECEADAFAALYLIGTIDLRDASVLEPVLDSASSCAAPAVLQALSLASDRDFVAGLDTVRAPSALRDGIERASHAARQWWHTYLGAYPGGDWRPAARLGLESRGYADSSRDLERALRDPSLRIRYQALRLLNDQYDTRIDLAPMLDAEPSVNVYAPLGDRNQSEATLRAYWMQRLDSAR
jgi:hypothetical protein